MKTLKCLILYSFATINLVFQVKCQSPSLQTSQSTSACYGQFSEETNMNATCDVGHVMAIGDLTVGAKPDSVGCPSTYNESYGYDTCCTYNQGTDCVFPLFSGNSNYHTGCNGKQTCYRQAQNQLVGDSCTSTNGNFSETSHFMFMGFFCIEEEKIVDMCSGPTTLTRENTEVYIWSRDFPTSSILSTDTNCNCSVEIDNCQALIYIYTMYRQLTGNGADTCNQTLRVGDADNDTILFEWTCDDNSLEFETDTAQKTYILINLENRRNGTDGKFWLGFAGTADSNITVSCPPTSQQYCTKTTTSTTTSTTTVTTTTVGTTSNMTITNATESTSSSTTTSTEAPTTSTTDATTTENVSTSAPKTVTGNADNNLLAAVIVLIVLVALLLIVVIVLSCCLYRRCCAKADDDVEKVPVESKQLPPQPDVTKAIIPDLKQSAYSPAPEKIVHVNAVDSPALEKIVHVNAVDSPALEKAAPVNAVDSGCQVQIDRVYTKEGPTELDLKQKAENLVKRNVVTPIELAEFGCQVNLFTSEIQNNKPRKEAKVQPPLQLADKETLTLSTQQAHKQCQTDVLRKKSQTTQANIEIRTSVKAASCETERAWKDEGNQKESKPVTNGIIPTSPHDKREAVPKKSVGVVPCNHQCKKTKRKKKRTVESHEEPDICISNKTSLEAIRPEIRQESPANQRFLRKTETEVEEDMSEETGTEGNEKYNRDIRTVHKRPEIRQVSPANQRFLFTPDTETDETPDETDTKKYNKDTRTIHVQPESPAADNFPPEVKHVLKIRNKIANSFFGKERYEERLMRLINKQSKTVRKKKRVDTNCSEC